MTKPMRTLLLADDAIRDRYRSVIRTLAACQLIGEVQDGEEGIHFASLCQPDLVFLGAGDETLVTARRLNSVAPWAKLVVIGAQPDEAERISLLQAGVVEFVPPESDDFLVSALERLTTPESVKESDEGRRPGKLIACYSPKGGAGRSTLAVNLAIALFRATGRETILVDGALFNGDLDLLLNLQPQQGLSAVLGGSRLEGAMTPHLTGIKLLAWTKGDRAFKLDSLKSLMLWLKQRDCWVVVDTHPTLRDANRVILEHADRVYLPLFLDIAHVRAIQRDFTQLREERIDTSRFELVVWNEKSDVSRQEASKILRRPLDLQLPADPAAARIAINQGIPTMQADPNGALGRALERMVESFSEPKSLALVPVKAGNPFSNLIAWFKKGPAGLGA